MANKAIQIKDGQDNAYPSVLIKSVTVNKPSSTINYISSGINSNENIVLSAYETSNPTVGANISLAANGTLIYAYAFYATGQPYNDAISITFYYIPIS